MAFPTPVRVVFIGLSSKPQLLGWLKNVHLPYFKSHSDYEIVGLLNSSVDAAKSAIEQNDLPASTKVYASPQALADDPDVDMVVCTLASHRIRDAIFPSVCAGKAVYTEWPFARNLVEAEELTAAARESGARTAVGLQARASAINSKLRELVQQGKIGNIRSSMATGVFSFFSGLTRPKSIAYTMERNSGATIVDVGFAHCKLYKI